MKINIHELKKITNEIDRAMTLGNKMSLERLIEDMMNLCQKIKDELEDKKKLSDSMKLEKINEIPFFYKPILKKNYYEGTYLEDFGQQRTSDLKDAKVLDVHNEFWKNHEVLRGNVFGSIPFELISKDAVLALKGFGWDEVHVEIFEIKDRKCTVREMVEYCELNYKHFLMVNEKSTGAELVLHFIV